MAKKHRRSRRRRRNPLMKDLVPAGVGLGMGILITYFYVSSLPGKALPA
jgi:hypothetical protein